MTPVHLVAAHVLAVAWLTNGEQTGAHTVQQPQMIFPSYVACAKAIPSFTEAFGAVIGSRGVVVCVPR